ncbi:hypothetical protein [Amycolatopsis rubida]|uniref:Lipoprotein n=1 Tax=Amycolatopsis rubida TaxID=112413 RepID=A0A1I5S267_9PSEU|nr:hypothetical protein [Amycolatopsis rubida]SFP64878.1 hypothetical protein SAMN05421854_106160 [Amycolatopsis rubida]
MAIAAVAGLAACSSETAAHAEVFGAAGYRGIATGKLASAPVSALEGCTVLSWQGGPAPDQARLAADSALASAGLAGKREERDKAFAAAGGASFGKNGLHELGAPPDARTAEGIGVGSPLADLHKAYDARGLKLGAAGRFEPPVAEKPGWRFEFTPAADGTVGGVAISDGVVKCR